MRRMVASLFRADGLDCAETDGGMRRSVVESGRSDKSARHDMVRAILEVA
jgi:hypothetical protein